MIEARIIAVADTAYQQVVAAGGDERDQRKYRKNQNKIGKLYATNLLGRVFGINPITGFVASGVGALAGQTQYTNTSPGQDAAGALWRAFNQTSNIFTGEYKKDRNVWRAYINLINHLGVPINNAFKSSVLAPRGIYRVLVGDTGKK